MVTPVSKTTQAQPVAPSKPAQKPAARKTQTATTDTVQLSSAAQAQLAHNHKLAAKASARQSGK